MTVLLEKLRALRSSPSGKQNAQPGGKPRKRRGWIMPVSTLVLGLAALFWFTSAKILGEPIHLGHGPEHPGFRTWMGSLLGAEFSDGNRVRVLVNGDQIFPEMLKAIRAARKTITLETYIWASGELSDQFIEALSERARAGVKVHVLVDGMGTLKFKDEDRERLLQAGAKVLKYGREHWWEVKPNINHRTHRKILVVDGKVGFTGGVCIDDKWLGNAQSPDVWRDTQVRVDGPSVRQLQAAFATNWLQTTQELLVGPDYFPPEDDMGDVPVQCYKSGPGENPESARISYMLAIAAARKSIKISHAYFVPDEFAVNTLLDARKRGVRIQIIIPAINDSRFGRAAARSRWSKLLEAGVEFHQYEPAMYHCKVMIVDDLFVTIGSVNFDNRSFAINDEVNLNLVDEAAARDHVRVFEDDLKHSKPYTREEHEGRPWYVKTSDRFCGLFRSQL
jgi:cardiolipin synthase A/B